MEPRMKYSIIVLAAILAITTALPRTRRQVELNENQSLEPVENNAEEEGSVREKRKLEAITQVKFGVKNALLGIVFGKINQLIDSKTRFIDTLDQQNIAKNKAYGIEAPSNGLGSLGGVITQVIGPKLQLIGPKLNLLTGVLGSSSGGATGSSSSAGASASIGGLFGGSGGLFGGAGASGGSDGGSGGSGGSNLGSLLRIFTSLSGSASGGGGGGGGTGTIETSSDEDD